MPQGNHHFTPHGLWYQKPATSSIPRLLLWSGTKLCMMGAAFYLLMEFRALSYRYTYKNFIGKTMSFGGLSTLTHEPLTAEEIDRLKASQSQK